MPQPIRAMSTMQAAQTDLKRGKGRTLEILVFSRRDKAETPSQVTAGLMSIVVRRSVVIKRGTQGTRLYLSDLLCNFVALWLSRVRR